MGFQGFRDAMTDPTNLGAGMSCMRFSPALAAWVHITLPVNTPAKPFCKVVSRVDSKE